VLLPYTAKPYITYKIRDIDRGTNFMRFPAPKERPKARGLAQHGGLPGWLKESRV
jgi:hypothetical protein